MKKQIIDKLFFKAKLRLLKLHYESNSGHLGGNLSSIDCLLTLYHTILSEKDLFVLSKGHSACALYISLWSKGLISEQTLKTYGKDGSVLPAHPSGKKIPGLLFSTGSLGHGPALSAGLALASKLKNKKNRIFCLCSDGEFQEGSVWETIIFANHHKLDNLIIFIDQNKLQGFGLTKDIVSYDNLESRISSFGVKVQTIDGHSPLSINNAVKKIKPRNLNIIILNTIKGIGLHNEGKLESHYLPLNADQYKEAIKNLREMYNQ